MQNIRQNLRWLRYEAGRLRVPHRIILSVFQSLPILRRRYICIRRNIVFRGNLRRICWLRRYPIASKTALDVKFSLAMSSMVFFCRLVSFLIASYIKGSVSFNRL